MYKCPHCNEEITYLCYKEDALIYGTLAIETEDYEQDEVESIGRLILTCPECDKEINSTDDLIDTEEESIDNLLNEEEEREESQTPNTIKEEKELPVPPAIDDEWKREYSGFNNSHYTPKLSEILICPQCGNKNEAKIDEDIECYSCNKEFNRNTAKKIIPLNNNNQGIIL